MQECLERDEREDTRAGDSSESVGSQKRGNGDTVFT